MIDSKKLELFGIYLKDQKFNSPLMYSDWNLVMDALRLLSHKHRINYFDNNILYSLRRSDFNSINDFINEIIFRYAKNIKNNKKNNRRYRNNQAVKEQQKIRAEEQRRVYKYTTPDKMKIEDWIKDTFEYFDNKLFEIDDDLSIYFFKSINIDNFKLEELPYKINSVIGDIDLRKTNIKTIKNFPNFILHGNLYQPKNLKYLDTAFDKKIWKGFPATETPIVEYFKYRVDQKYYELFLSCIEGGNEIIEIRKNTKKYRTIFFDSEKKIYELHSTDLYLIKAKQYLNLYSDHFLIEEDDGLYKYEYKNPIIWSEEEFKNRHSKEEIERLTLIKKKEEVLNKLSIEERQILGI